MSNRRFASFTLPSAIACILSVAVITGCAGTRNIGSPNPSGTPGSSSSTPAVGSQLTSVKTLQGVDALAVDSSTHSVYVLDPQNPSQKVGTLVVVNNSTNTVETTVPLSAYPDAIALDQTTNMLYIANKDADTVSVLNGATNAIVATIPVGNAPASVAVDPTTNVIYVANSVDGTVSVIDGSTNKVTATVPVGDHPDSIVVNAAGGQV